MPKHLAEPNRWYRKSEEQGITPAQFKLGTMHETGSGVSPGEAEAYRSFARAAAAGNTEASADVRRVEAEMPLRN